MRFRTIVMTLLAGLVVLPVSVLAIAYLSSPDYPPLVKGLPGGSYAATNAAFATRLRTQFPLGSNIEELASELKRQGFETETETMASLYISTFPCAYTWQVYWETDTAGLLTGLGGVQRTSCL